MQWFRVPSILGAWLLSAQGICGCHSVPGEGAPRAAESATGPDALPSWNDGGSKRRILQFVDSVTREGAPGFVAPKDRIAVFDNDGTLWVEQPLYVEAAFALDRVEALAVDHPEWRENPTFDAVLNHDRTALVALDQHAVGQMLALSHAGMTTDEFVPMVQSWFRSALHPVFDRPYTRCVYRPMLELLGHLKTRGFATFIVSAGGTDFMRAISDETYGIASERVVGSRGKLRFELRGATAALVKLPELASMADAAGKPINIHWHIGKRPILAFGNSDGDLEMLQYTHSGSGPRLALLLHHDDAAREFAYDRASRIGKLDRALHEARERNWVVVSMKSDWNTVWPRK